MPLNPLLYHQVEQNCPQHLLYCSNIQLQEIVEVESVDDNVEEPKTDQENCRRPSSTSFSSKFSLAIAASENNESDTCY